MESSGSTTSNSGAWSAEESIAGNGEALQALRELITYPLLYHRESKKLGLKWPRGLLLYGPPGTGKTSLVRAVVRECGAHLSVISPHSVHRAHAGESERTLRESFAEALAKAKESGKPSVIFIDEIDALCPRRDSRKEHDIRVTSQLIMLMDANNKSSSSSMHVVVVASTNRVDTIDPALRRSGRFHEEIEVTTPNEEERFQILKLYAKKLPLDPDVDLKSVAASCNGYVGADLEALCREAALSVFRKASDANVGENVSITAEDWKCARSIVGPSITRGVTVEVPKVSWDDIGGLHELKKKLQQAVEWPLKHATAFSRLGVSPVRGILLHGPPGCSKTTLAKAAGHAAQASFFSLSGAELFSMYVGEGEALLRNTFRRARLAAPSIIFFDEADVVAAKRGGSSSGSTVVRRETSIYSADRNGRFRTDKRHSCFSATNRPYAIDAALMRPGRFDLVLYVPPPDTEARYEILCVHTRNMSVDPDIDLRKLAEETDLFTGAELEGLCKEAGIVALREDIAATVVCDRHFQKVKRSLKPALTKEEVNTYASFMKNPNMMRPKCEQQLKEIQPKCDGKKKRNLLGVYVPITVSVVCLIVCVAGVRFFGSSHERVQRYLAST